MWFYYPTAKSLRPSAYLFYITLLVCLFCLLIRFNHYQTKTTSTVNRKKRMMMKRSKHLNKHPSEQRYSTLSSNPKMVKCSICMKSLQSNLKGLHKRYCPPRLPPHVQQPQNKRAQQAVWKSGNWLVCM